MSTDGPRVGGGKKKARDFEDDDETEKKPAAKKPAKKASNAPEIDGWDCRNEDVMIRSV